MGSIDQQLFLALNFDGGPTLDSFMWWASGKWSWVPLYVFLLLAMKKKLEWKPFFWALVMIAVCIAINDQVASGLFKNWIQRLRPSHEPALEGLVHLVREPNGNWYKGGSFGFYSSHAANNAGVACFFLLLMNVREWQKIVMLLFMVLTVGYSRIYLGVHYPGDILMGFFMGIIIGWLCYQVYKWGAEKMNLAQ
ncbi:MAG: phosphatase PAP2 family protein [Flavobacteriales bacterium]|jgi:undecaprenyl-diphosphatase